MTPPTPRPDPPLTLTGERTMPGIPDERYWFQRHVVAYRHAATVLHDLRATDPAPVALDAGCGEGYGLALLADAGAHRVVGADLDGPTVAHASATYAGHDPRVEVVRAELSALPLEDAEVALTVSFQVIEHLHDVPGYLAELGRVTVPGGTVAIATPNRLTFTPDRDVPVNPFHVREFSAAELRAELTAAGLIVERLLGVRHGPRLTAFERSRDAALPDLLTGTAPGDWDRELRDLVHAVEPTWFALDEHATDDALDLLAVCRVPTAGQDRRTERHTSR